MHTLHPVIVLLGINSFFSFLIIVNPPFLGTTCTGLTQGLSEIAYMKPAFSYFSTSFMTTSFITRFCKTRENSNFLKNGKMVISVKIRNFSRSRMMKRTSPLESSREI